jgi:hypothetical protein
MDGVLDCGKPFDLDNDDLCYLPRYFQLQSEQHRETHEDDARSK